MFNIIRHERKVNLNDNERNHYTPIKMSQNKVSSVGKGTLAVVSFVIH